MKSVIIIAVISIISISSAAYVNSNTTQENINDYKLEGISEEIPQGMIEEFQLSTENIYLPIGGSEKIEYVLNVSGKLEVVISSKSDDESIATIDENGIIYGVNTGITNIRVYANDVERNIKVTVTSLIIPVPNEPNTNKELLKNKNYTKDENDLLDEILSDRVQKAGYHTRAGVVAAARFIGLEFPYRVPYFSENGRLNTYGWKQYVDGEGRYYHKGLYLNSSRYTQLNKTLYGPGVWGSYIYSVPSGGKRANGFDCSGFIAWIIHNGGYDPGDIGAGITSIPDMTDLGEKKLLKNSIANNAVKAGDLLSGKGSSGGHIALVAGIKDSKYYVAESLWAGTGYFGAIIRAYDHDKISDNFYWHIDMENFYESDGNYTAYWK